MPLSRRPENGLSHVRGDTDSPLLDVTIPKLLADTVARFAPREAVVFRAHGIRWTWEAFAAEVDRVAAGLLAAGIAPGDRVGIWSPNRPEWLLIQFATARVGAIMVCLNPAYRAREVEFALNAAGCRLLVMARRFRQSDYVAMLEELAPELAQAAPGALRAARLPELRDVVVTGDDPAPAGMRRFSTLQAQADRGTLDRVSAGLTPDDPINIQFTSGTTGAPKGACLTHRNIVNNAHFTTATMAFTEADSLCIPVPFYHCFGMVMGTLGCVTKGARMVIPGEGFDPAETLAAVSEEGCTALYGVPTMFVAELGLPEFADYDLGRLRTGIMAGAPCPIEVMKKVQGRMNMTGITIAYGMTETSPVSFQSNMDDPLEQRVSSVGRVHPHVECRIADPEGRTVPVGTQGELMTRGYSVMQGYWGLPDRTAEAIDAEGWMHTGDLAVMDGEGYCRITGRLKDMILRGGENIYPKELEDVLFAHPALAQAQVFGIPDDRLGEVVCAYVVPHPGAAPSEDEIRAFCRAEMAHFKVPLHIRLRESLPMTVTGKPQKFVMRAELMVELGLTDPGACGANAAEAGG
ncbi:AMP-binding protein [Oceaniglobus roseus]|uniref:AMP-binding protein n=1 Tax=Oceaniglobus roseus TaxID=1737570 RepID=UPI000C7EF2F8|nr:AMP-binding protein [Kandeliimicrobium roseum]